MKSLFYILVCFILMSSSANAAVLNFDNGEFPNKNGGQMEYSYDEFKWYNLEEAFDNNPTSWRGNHEAFSGSYALKTVNDRTKYSSIEALDLNNPFYFTGLNIRTYSAKDMNITISGIKDGSVQFVISSVLTKDYIGIKNIAHRDTLINKLVIDWGTDQGGINIDNFGYDYTPAPEPSSLLIGGLAGIAGFLRRFFKVA